MIYVSSNIMEIAASSLSLSLPVQWPELLAALATIARRAIRYGELPARERLIWYRITRRLPCRLFPAESIILTSLSRNVANLMPEKIRTKSSGRQMRGASCECIMCNYTHTSVHTCIMCNYTRSFRYRWSSSSRRILSTKSVYLLPLRNL